MVNRSPCWCGVPPRGTSPDPLDNKQDTVRVIAVEGGDYLSGTKDNTPKRHEAAVNALRANRIQLRYPSAAPPSGQITCPVTNDASSDARKAQTSPISSMVAILPKGCQPSTIRSAAAGSY